ncbi:hypothetical protein cypCar_00048955 [Cyprinus carpio]|nr:hypothetical protein cypCar_00048955 [Cyprinus carpio]
MSCMTDFARKCIMNKDITVNPVTVEDVLSHPCKFAELDLNTITLEQLRDVRGVFSCRCFGSFSFTPFACVHGDFPLEEKALVLLSRLRSQARDGTGNRLVLYLDDAVDVEDTKVEGEISLHPSEENSRHICIRVDYVIGEQKKHSKTFSIPDQFLEVK